MAAERMYTLMALTDIWTGDANRQGERLIATGLLGSIRWWFEVLVRGLGGSACDPTLDGNRCPDPRKQPHEPGHHCVVCELFGCTGWARKFRFEVLDEKDQPKRSQITKGKTFKLRFTELRPIFDEEWALLDLTLRLIAEYGAIGGRTILKPSEEPGLADLDLADFEQTEDEIRVKRVRKGLPLRKEDIIKRVGDTSVCSLDVFRKTISGTEHGEPVCVVIIRDNQETRVPAWYGKRYHIDYGLVEIQEPQHTSARNSAELRRYCTQPRWRSVDHDDFAWASLRNFWCVKRRFLARQSAETSTFNKVIGRPEPKHESNRGDSWLAGRRASTNQSPESKKVFSFENPSRTFGFVNPDRVDFGEMRRRLQQACSGFQDSEFHEGPRILDALFTARAGGTP